ncbi:MAG: GNAT family N-acetyltransferase [Armatimonadota bacterium]
MFILDFLKRLADYCYKRDVLFVYYCDIAQTLQQAPPMLTELTAYACDQHNYEQLRTVLKPFPPVIGGRIKRGDIAFIAAQGSKWIFRASVILGPKDYPVIGYSLHLQEQDVYMECAETIPGWRGKGIAPGMLRTTMQTLLDRGYTRSFLTIAITNTSSCRAIEKGGGQRIGLITARRLFGRWQSMYISLTEDEQFALVAC